MASQWQRGARRGMPESVRMQVLGRLRDGCTWAQVQDEFGCSHHLLWLIVREAGGMPPSWPCRSSKHLSLDDREEISRSLALGRSFAVIGARTQRSTSTISREVNRNGGRQLYRAAAADRATCARAKRPRKSVFEERPVLAFVVENWLRQGMSPEQISGRLIVEFADDDTMRVVPETIYQALFVQGRGGLNKELVKCLRTRRPRRKPHAVTARNTGKILDKVMIGDRPAEIEDRAVPGHWEGDLIIGNRAAPRSAPWSNERPGSCCWSNYPTTAPQQQSPPPCNARSSPCPPRRADRSPGTRESRWPNASFTIATNIAIYFCDPHSPWQRGTNENTNGLLRQYLPHATDLSVHSQAELDDIAAKLNNRPRKRHGFLTPLEMFNQVVLH